MKYVHTSVFTLDTNNIWKTKTKQKKCKYDKERTSKKKFTQKCVYEHSYTWMYVHSTKVATCVYIQKEKDNLKSMYEHLYMHFELNL